MLRRAFDAKFWAHLTTIQATLPYLAEEGSITLLGAISARAAMPGTAGIAAVNGAVEALVKPLAVELAPRRVNGVSPGFVDTPWWSGLPEEARRAYFRQRVMRMPQVNASEDVGVFGAAIGVPTVFWFWGGLETETVLAAMREGTLDKLPGNHSPFFAPLIEPALSTGVEVLVTAALVWLGGTD